MADKQLGGVVPGESFPAASQENADGNAYINVWGVHIGDALDPPYAPEILYLLYTHSPYLRPNVEGYVTNVDGLGHTWSPLINLDDADAAEKIRHELDFERWLEAGGDPRDSATDEEFRIADDEVERAMARLRVVMVRQRLFLERWFSTASLDGSFTALRKQTRADLEVFGNAYWEVIRGRGGRVLYFKRFPARTMRLMRRDTKPTRAMRIVRRSVFRGERIRYAYRFCRFVQVVGNQRRFFREFGDPRVVSSQTGKVYRNVAEMRAKEPEGVPANEVIHFKIEDPAYEYGVPRWVGSLINLMSSRKADQVNHDFFDNKAIPPLVAFVNGGRFKQSSVDAVKDLFKAGKGLDKFWDVLFLEAEPDPGAAMEATGRTEIKLEPLMKAQPSDGMFQKLDERNADKVGGMFRLGRLMRGDTRDFNKATADALLRFSEGQVYKPERDEFDDFMNDFVLPELGVSAWRIQSKGPSTTSAAERGEMTIKALKERAIDRNEAREALEPALGVRLPRGSDNGYEDE